MENTTGTKKRGRPRKDAAELKRHNVTIAMAAPIREAIQRAADESGRSVSSEIDFRLGMSLALDKDTGHASVRRLVDFTRLAATKMVEEAGTDWTDDGELASRIIGAVMGYVRRNSPLPEEWQRERELDVEDKRLEGLLERLKASPVTGDKFSDEELAQLNQVEELIMALGTGYRDLEIQRRITWISGVQSVEELIGIFAIKPGQPVDG